MNNDNLGPAMSTSMNTGGKKSGHGLMTSIVIIVLVIVAILLAMSKNKMVTDDTTVQGDNTTLSPADEQAAGAEATAGFSTSDDLDSIETDLNAAEASEFE